MDETIEAALMKAGTQLERKDKKIIKQQRQINDLKRKCSLSTNRLQCLWEFLQELNKETGIEPPHEFFGWFDENSAPKTN